VRSECLEFIETAQALLLVLHAVTLFSQKNPQASVAARYFGVIPRIVLPSTITAGTRCNG
jgi:hypothetical protein